VATLRSNGVLSAQVTPQGGWITGTSSVMHLDGWNWEDALIREDDAIHLNWPGYFSRPAWWRPDAKVGKSEDYDAESDAIRSYFEQARAYAEKANASGEMPMADINLAFEAMRGVFPAGDAAPEKKVFIRCRTAKEIAEVVAFAEGLELDYVLVDAHQAPEVADLLRRYDVPVLLEQIHRLPPYAHSRVDYSYTLPARLQREGIRFAIAHGGGWDAFWDVRNLVYHAGTAAARGLPKEEAIAAISGNVAKLLGLSDQYGTVAEGLQATFFVCPGDVLDMRTSQLSHAWIQGRPVDLDADPQKQLYQIYKDKYGLE
jgi:imidazolonepropionase-like amidohydrolase